MTCPSCGSTVSEEASQCPACNAVLEAHGTDTAAAGGVKPGAVRTKPVRADDVTAADFTSRPAPEVGTDVLTPPPTFESTPTPTSNDARGPASGRVDFGPRYRVERLLGQGGMGAVYLAYDQDLGRQVALKLVRAEFMMHADAMARFRQELLLASKISHRNILRIHDLGDAGGMKFISMAYVDGEDLHHLLVRERKLPDERMLNIARQLCAALDAAHAEGVVHRDLKPQNIMLDKDDHVFVSDFGMAKSLDEVSGLTQTGAILGTPLYMAPEQVEARSVDARTDIYALGLILYEMVTGQVPFKTETTLHLMYKRAHEVPPAPKSVSSDVPDWLNNVIMKCLERDPANRYQSAAEILTDIDAQGHSAAALRAVSEVAAASLPSGPAVGRTMGRRYTWIAVATAVALALAIGGFFSVRRSHALTVKDTVVLADFTNRTGDAVFDDTLKQALAVDLGQSPFLNILSDGKVQATLQQMTRSPSEHLSDEVAREVCQRTGSKAFISGSIAALGNQYVIGLNAINCATGDPLAREEIQAAGKEKVLDALGSSTAKLRGELGESLPSVQKFDVPLEQATTPSLEALKAFSLGRKQNSAAAVPFYERAIELDPNFAEAYARLGVMYHNLGQPEQATENVTKAFELREHATERDKFHIASSYYVFGTGELEKAIQTYQLWAQSYPRDWVPLLDLGVADAYAGRYEKAAEATLESLRLYPDNVTAYENLGGYYLALNRFSEAQDATTQALARKLDEEVLHTNLYILAFLRGDSGGMAQQAAWFEGKAEVENEILGLESATEAYFGRLDKARELTRRAVLSAENAQNKEEAANWSAEAAVREALLGNDGVAREQAGAALSLAPGSRDAESEAALALALAGDAARAQALLDELNREFPLYTMTQSVWLPTIRGQLAINRKTPSAAVELLQGASPFELGLSIGQLNYSCLYPVYIRAQAFLAGGDGAAAATELQKILDHRGLMGGCITSPLARLGLARVYAAQKDTVKARAAYQDFLSLWKDADPDIPILKQAKAEYAEIK